MDLIRKKDLFCNLIIYYIRYIVNRFHFSSSGLENSQNKLFLYIETTRLLRKVGNKCITLVFDTKKVTYKNFDLKFVKSTI